MGFKEEMNREIRNVKKDLSLAIDKKYSATYKENEIVLHNELMRESLYVNGELVAQKVRTSFWSHILPSSTLKANFIGVDGKTYKVKAKLSGIIQLKVNLSVNGKTIFNDKIKFDMNPWDHKTPIVPYIEDQARQGSIQPALPDDHIYILDGEQPPAPGVSDQTFALPVSHSFVKKIFTKLQAQIENPNDATRKATYEKLLEARLIDYLDFLIFEMNERQFNQEALQREIDWFLQHATHKEVVKFAIALLGFIDTKNYQQKIETIAQHEEFTGVALFALKHGKALTNEFSLNLVKSLKGWGKIAALDFLDAHTDEIRSYLLTDALANSDYPPQVAMYCIEKGKLDILLHEKEITHDQYIGAYNLLHTLLHENEIAILDGYEFTGQIMQRFVVHSKTHLQSIEQFYTLVLLANSMEKSEDDWEGLYEVSWKPFQRSMVIEGIAEIAAKHAFDHELKELINHSKYELPLVLQLLAYYKVDLSEEIFTQLQNRPHTYDYFEYILRIKNKTYIEKTANYISEQLQISTFENDVDEMIIMTFVMNLDEHEGLGLPLLKKAIHSNEPMLQLSALSVLNSWRNEFWQDLYADVEKLAQTTKDKNLKQFTQDMLEKK